jgi:raffinose/stachyose/melibiose transport system substrate-binding protein
VPALEQALTDVTKYLQQYTTKDALGAGYAVIENHFMNETTSILINGVWACSNLYENLGDKVGVAKFPEDTAIINYERGYVVCQQKNDSEGKIAQAAAEFIKFKTSAFGQQTVLDYDGAAPLTDAIKVTEGSKSDNPLFNKAIEAALSADNKVGQLNYKWQAEVADELVKQYANLVDESKTPEEVCNILTEIVQK